MNWLDFEVKCQKVKGQGYDQTEIGQKGGGIGCRINGSSV